MDPELSNNRGTVGIRPGIGDGSDKGTAYFQEYHYHDKRVWDECVTYIRSTTPIALYRTEWCGAEELHSGSVICHRIDRDLCFNVNWHDRTHHPAYSAPFTLASKTYEDGSPVVGTTGPKPGIPFTLAARNDYYHRGSLDSIGREWHAIITAVDCQEYTYPSGSQAGKKIDTEYNVRGGRQHLLVVDPPCPCLCFRATGNAQFYTTPPKFYFLPQIHDQETYILPRTGGVTVEIRDIFGNNIHYRIVTSPADAGTAYTHPGASHATLTDAAFPSGVSYLQVYRTGNEAVILTRKITKNPAFPSAGEPRDARLLFGYKKHPDDEHSPIEKTFLQNIGIPATPSWKPAWDALLTRTTVVDNTFQITGARIPTTSGVLEQAPPKAVLEPALIALMKGIDYKLPSATRTHAEWAKQAMLMNLTRIDPVGLELHHNGAAIPSREVKDRGYFTVGSRGRYLDVPFSYNILISIYRSDQHPDGITPVEDLWLRDSMARWVMFCKTEIGGYCPHNPGMWGRCRFVAAQVIALAMPSYSTRYYGTSGVDGNTTVYTHLPFPSAGYTWKELFIDESNPVTAYPDCAYKADYDNQWTSPGDLDIRGELIDQGGWGDRMSYHRQIQSGWAHGVLAMMSALHTGREYPNLFRAAERWKSGDLRARTKQPKDGVDRFGPQYGEIGFLTNDLFPVNSPQHVQWYLSNETKRGELIKYGSVYSILWMDIRNGIISRAPVFAPGAGGYEDPASVTVSAGTGAEIHVTTDGSDPVPGVTPVYSGAPIAVAEPRTLKAVAVEPYTPASPVVAAHYDVDTTGRPASPVDVVIL